MGITSRIADISSLLLECCETAAKGGDFSDAWDNLHDNLELFKSHLYELKDKGPERYNRDVACRHQNHVNDSLARKRAEGENAVKPTVVPIVPIPPSDCE